LKTTNLFDRFVLQQSANGGQRIALDKTLKHAPRHRAFAITAIKPFAPAPFDFTVETLEKSPITRDTVLRVMSVCLLTQLLLLNANRLVPV